MAKIKITSDSANKMIRELNQQLRILDVKSKKCSTFISTIKYKEVDRPKFSLEEATEEMYRLEQKIITLRSAIHSFNVDYVLENGMTVDAALLNLNYLQKVKDNFASLMETVDGKRKVTSSVSHKAEYYFINFDMKYVEEMYNKTCDTIVNLQSLINKANVIVEFEVDMPD